MVRVKETVRPDQSLVEFYQRELKEFEKSLADVRRRAGK